MQVHLGVFRHRKRVCTESWQGEKFLATSGNWTCVSGMPVRRSASWATSRLTKSLVFSFIFYLFYLLDMMCFEKASSFQWLWISELMLLKGGLKWRNIIGTVDRNEINKIDTQQLSARFLVLFVKDQCLKVTKTWPGKLCDNSIKNTLSLHFHAVYCWRANQHGCALRNSNSNQISTSFVYCDRTTQRILQMETFAHFLGFQANLQPHFMFPVIDVGLKSMQGWRAIKMF